eukprot:8756575-Pyramimonas_sp.AAC.1
MAQQLGPDAPRHSLPLNRGRRPQPRSNPASPRGVAPSKTSGQLATPSPTATCMAATPGRCHE